MTALLCVDSLENISFGMHFFASGQLIMTLCYHICLLTPQIMPAFLFLVYISDLAPSLKISIKIIICRSDLICEF